MLVCEVWAAHNLLPTTERCRPTQLAPQALRLNLNTLLLHGVFDQPEGISLRFSMGPESQPRNVSSESQPDANALRLITLILKGQVQKTLQPNEFAQIVQHQFKSETLE